jgi:uncharacterized membrane protein YfcA
MFEPTLQLLMALFLAAVLAGFIDAIAGGGGLITLPAMLLAGLPPLQALGTNKLQSLFGSGTASWNYARHGHVDIRARGPLALLAAAGAALGASAAAFIPASWLQLGLPLLLIGIAVYFALKPGHDEVARQRRLSPRAIALGFVPAMGVYDGLFGPGTGSLLMLGLVALAGYGMLAATAHTKLLNFGSNLGALVVFALTGAVVWKLGLVMAAGQVIGARLGSRFAMRHGARVIKPLLVTVSVLLAMRLLADPAHPLRQWLGL